MGVSLSVWCARVFYDGDDVALGKRSVVVDIFVHIHKHDSS